jgi:5-methylcytosine-specific restriction protein A
LSKNYGFIEIQLRFSLCPNFGITYLEGGKMFEVGKTYNRRADIHKVYGGQQQGGICTPKDYHFVILFTGVSGEQYGYSDGWDENGVFRYIGEGQRGNMQFLRGNKAIRDHQLEGKDLLLFETLSKRAGVRYMGTFACSTWEHGKGKDLDGNIRKTIEFHLVPTNGEGLFNIVLPVSPYATLSELKRRAYEAASQATQSTIKDAKKIYYQRSEKVKEYVLARSKGKCERCKVNAPFAKPNGVFYLEPHHIRKISDGGPDHPRWIAALCPNCHREAHFGMFAKDLNNKLAKVVCEIEKE